MTTHSEASKSEASSQRLFFILMIATSFVVCSLLAFVWVVGTVGFSYFHQVLPLVMGIFFTGCMGIIFWGVLGFIIKVYTGKSLLGFDAVRGLSLTVLFPVIEIVARIFNVSLKEVRRAFININNMLMDMNKKYKAEDVLVILPHCVQTSKCKLRLTYNSDNCARCGKCSITDLLRIRDTWGVQIATASGGTMARNIIAKVKPKFIIGTACERDLFAGIQDTKKISIFGVLLTCSNGACMDTALNIVDLEKSLETFVIPAQDINEQKLGKLPKKPKKEFMSEISIPHYKKLSSSKISTSYQ